MPWMCECDTIRTRRSGLFTIQAELLGPLCTLAASPMKTFRGRMFVVFEFCRGTLVLKNISEVVDLFH